MYEVLNKNTLKEINKTVIKKIILQKSKIIIKLNEFKVKKVISKSKIKEKDNKILIFSRI